MGKVIVNVNADEKKNTPREYQERASIFSNKFPPKEVVDKSLRLFADSADAISTVWNDCHKVEQMNTKVLEIPSICKTLDT